MPAGARGLPGPLGPPGPPGGAAIPPPTIVCANCPASASTTGGLSFDDTSKLIESAADVKATAESFKFLLPLVITVLLGVIPALAAIGAYYIRKESEKLQDTMEAQVTQSLKEQREAFEKELRISNEMRKADFEDHNAQLKFQVAGVRYTLALLAWKNRDYPNAIYQIRSALDSSDRAISTYESLNLRSRDHHRDITDYLKYRCYIIGDAAFYLVDDVNPPNDDNTIEAMNLAHRLIKEWAIFGEEVPLPLIDNYLFVLAKVKVISEQEKKRGSELWKDKKALLHDHFRKELGVQLAEDRRRLFDEFFGSV